MSMRAAISAAGAAAGLDRVAVLRCCLNLLKDPAGRRSPLSSCISSGSYLGAVWQGFYENGFSKKTGEIIFFLLWLHSTKTAFLEKPQKAGGEAVLEAVLNEP